MSRGRADVRPLSITISMLDHCHVQQFYSLFPSPRSLHVLSCFHHASLGQTCYLELSRGFTYTLHISPLAMGARVLFPRSLKDPPCPSCILSQRICCLGWKRVSLLHTGELPGLSRCPLVRPLLHVICHKDPRWYYNRPCWWRLSRICDVRPSFFADSSTYLQRVTVLLSSSRPTYSQYGEKSSRVSHTSSRMGL